MPDPLTSERPVVRTRNYKTAKGRDRAMKRYGSRVVWWGAGTSNGAHRYQLGVMDLDEYGQPPAVECPCCGRLEDE